MNAKIAAILLVIAIMVVASFIRITRQVAENESKIGVSIDPFNLNYGILPLGSNNTKMLVINNYEKGPVKVSLYVSGNISPFITFSENNFILDKTSKEVWIKMAGASEGNFTGTLYASIKKPLAGWLISWI
jgi:hypothetical protein